VFYVLPRVTTDSILPITIQPQPKELVRVLVGRVEIITPEIEATIVAQVHRLGDPSFRVRELASKELKKQGRFAEPTLKQVMAKTSDPEIKQRIKEVLQQDQPTPSSYSYE